MHVLSYIAYLDAGTGSLLIQALIGVLAGIGVFWRRILASIKSKFSGKGTTETAATKTSGSAKK